MGGITLLNRRSTDEGTHPGAGLLGMGTLVALLTLSGCTAPAVAGCQIQAAPGGFVYTAVAKNAGGVLPWRSLVSFALGRPTIHWNAIWAALGAAAVRANRRG